MSNSFFDSIRQRVDIVSTIQRFVQIKRKGRDYIGLCPFHGEKTPSFTVNVQKGFYHCFGCAAHGDVIQFTAALSGLSYKSAAMQLAKEHGVPIPSFNQEKENEVSLLYRVNEAANSFFTAQLSKEALEYLKSRQISQNLIDAFSIGYAPGGALLRSSLEKSGISLDLMEKAGLVASGDKVYEVLRRRVTFPIKTAQGEILGFGGRTIDSSNPKYLNTPETSIFKKSKVFFGEDLAMSASYKLKQIVLAEGYFDVIALHSAGIQQAVGTLGTAITKQHLEKAWRHVDEIVLCLDGDAAGVKATFRAAELAAEYLTTEKQLSIMPLPNNTDPDQARLLKVDLAACLENRVNLSQWLWDYFGRAKTSDTPEQKARAEQKFIEYANSLTDKVLKKHYYLFVKEKGSRKPTKAYPIKIKAKNIDSAKPYALKAKAGNELQNIEDSLIKLLRTHPTLLEEDFVLESLSRLEISNPEMDLLISQVDHNKIKGTNNSDKGINEVKSFKMLYKRHRLETLKLEYLNLLKTSPQSEGLAAYSKEIASLNLEIVSLIES
jgi:DNA primase